MVSQFATPIIIIILKLFPVLRSREWEKAEMEGRRMSGEQIMTRSGYGRKKYLCS